MQIDIQSVAATLRRDRKNCHPKLVLGSINNAIYLYDDCHKQTILKIQKFAK
jgi:hypothetical protein